MKHLFLSPELSTLAQEKGFNEPCMMGWNKSGELSLKISSRLGGGSHISWDTHDSHIPAPIYQQIIDWLITKNIVVTQLPRTNPPKWALSLTYEQFDGAYIIEEAIKKALKSIK